MKRPVTILCIADLHLQEQLNGQCKTEEPMKILKSDLHHFRDSSSDRCNWTPDFLLIAGDLVDRCTQPSYEYVQQQIDELIRLFNIAPFRVVLTPGNHDRQTYSPKSECRKQALKKNTMRQNIILPK